MTVLAGGLGASSSDMGYSVGDPYEQFLKGIKENDPFKNEKLMPEGNNFIVPLQKGTHIVIDDNETKVEIPYDCNVVVTFVVRPRRNAEPPANFAPGNINVPKSLEESEAFQLYLKRTAAVAVFMKSQGRTHRDGFDDFRTLSHSIPDLVDICLMEGRAPGSIERTGSVISELLKMQTNGYDPAGSDTTEMVALSNVVK